MSKSLVLGHSVSNQTERNRYLIPDGHRNQQALVLSSLTCFVSRLLLTFLKLRGDSICLNKTVPTFEYIGLNIDTTAITN